MATADKVLRDALALKPAEKVELIDQLLSSLDNLGVEVEAARANEADRRIDACGRAAIKAVGLKLAPARAGVVDKHPRVWYHQP